MDNETRKYIMFCVEEMSENLTRQFDNNINDRINSIKEHVVEETNLQLENLNLQDLHWCEQSMYMLESLKGAKKQQEMFKISLDLQRNNNVINKSIAHSLKKIVEAISTTV